jgi:hypothetical protein
MRTSLIEIQQIDEHLLNRQLPQDALLFEARLIINPQLREDVFFQKQTLALMHQYGRNSLRKQIEDIHLQLFTKPQHKNFRQSILGLFKS